jgi:hypothetical protein
MPKPHDVQINHVTQMTGNPRDIVFSYLHTQDIAQKTGGHNINSANPDTQLVIDGNVRLGS